MTIPSTALVDRLFRSAGVRFGVIYAALFGISAAALAAFLWWSTLGLLDRQTDTAIETDAQALSERYAAGGLPALVELSRQRIESNGDVDAVYLVTDPAFRKIGGNLDGWPRGMMIDAEREEIAIMREDVMVTSALHHYELPAGFHLLVGRDVEAKTGLRRLMRDAMVWAAGIAIALGSVGARARYEFQRAPRITPRTPSA